MSTENWNGGLSIWELGVIACGNRGFLLFWSRVLGLIVTFRYSSEIITPRPSLEIGRFTEEDELPLSLPELFFFMDLGCDECGRGNGVGIAFVVRFPFSAVIGLVLGPKWTLPGLKTGV